MSPLAKN